MANGWLEDKEQQFFPPPTNNILVTYGALQVLYCIVLYCIVQRNQNFGETLYQMHFSCR